MLSLIRFINKLVSDLSNDGKMKRVTPMFVIYLPLPFFYIAYVWCFFMKLGSQFISYLVFAHEYMTLTKQSWLPVYIQIIVIHFYMITFFNSNWIRRNAKTLTSFLRNLLWLWEAWIEINLTKRVTYICTLILG